MTLLEKSHPVTSVLTSLAIPRLSGGLTEACCSQDRLGFGQLPPAQRRWLRAFLTPGAGQPGSGHVGARGIRTSGVRGALSDRCLRAQAAAGRTAAGGCQLRSFREDPAGRQGPWGRVPRTAPGGCSALASAGPRVWCGVALCSCV